MIKWWVKFKMIWNLNFRRIGASYLKHQDKKTKKKKKKILANKENRLSFVLSNKKTKKDNFQRNFKSICLQLKWQCNGIDLAIEQFKMRKKHKTEKKKKSFLFVKMFYAKIEKNNQDRLFLNWKISIIETKHWN